MKKLKLKRGEILVLRNVWDDMTSYGGFKWPRKGFIEAPDWKDDYKCGSGLHGLPWGVGDVSYLYEEPCVWLVVKVDTTEGYNYGKGEMKNKCKFRRGEVVYYGDRDGAIELIAAYAPEGLPINYVKINRSDKSILIGGYGSNITCGDYSIVKGGAYSNIESGDGSIIICSYYSTIKTGDDSTVETGGDSNIKAGNRTVITCGDRAIITCGNYSTIIVGVYSNVKTDDCCTVKASYWSNLTGGYYSNFTGGINSILKGGNYSNLTSGAYSTLIGGKYSILTGGEGSIFKADEESVLICLYNRTAKVKIIDNESANKFFKVKNNNWIEVKEDKTELK